MLGALLLGLAYSFLGGNERGGATERDAAVPLVPPVKQWVRFDSPTFRTYSGIDRQRTTRIIDKLEKFRQYMADFTPFRTTVWEPITVFILPDQETYKPYSPFENSAGFFSATPDHNFICICADPRLPSDRIVYHEFTHYMVNGTFSSVPMWASEGLAEYFSGFRLEKRAAILGLPLSEHVAWLRRHQLLETRDLMTLSTRSEEYQEGEAQGTVYAQSWALVHMLMQDKAGDKGEGLLRYLVAVADGAAPDSACDTHLHRSPERLDSAIRNYVTRDEYSASRVELAGDVGEEKFEERPTGPAEVLTALGGMLARTAAAYNDDVVDAHLDAAGAAGGDSTEIGLARAWRSARRNDRPGALARLRKIVAADPMNWRAAYAMGSIEIASLPDEASEGAGAADSLQSLIDDARLRLNLCVNLKPDFVPGLVMLGQSYLVESQPGAEPVRALEQARRLCPGNNDAAATLAILYARRGDLERARQIVAGRLDRLSDRRLATLVNTEIRQRRSRDVARLVEAGDLAGAAALLETQVAAAPAGPERDRLEEAHRHLREVIRRRSQSKLYDEGLNLARQGHRDEALGRLTEVLRLCFELENDAEPVCVEATRLRDALRAGKTIH